MKILVPIDGSKSSKKSIDVARDMGEKLGADLLILTDAETDLSGYPNKVETFYTSGNPGEQICKFADEKDVDFIVMGNRGLGAFSRTLLGSVSNKVINHSKKSVLVVKADI